MRQNKYAALQRKLLLFADPKHAPASPEALVLAPEENLLDAHLAECGRTHDAGLDGHVQRRLRERVQGGAVGRERLVREDFVNRLQLRVSGCLGAVGGLCIRDGRRKEEKSLRTLRSWFVRLRARAMTCPCRTKTQPTGTSCAARASSA